MQGLPPEAATWRVGGQQWTALHELIAIQAELIDQWGLVQTRIRVGDKGLPKKSLRIPRPGADSAPEPGEQKDEVITSAAEIKAFFG